MHSAKEDAQCPRPGATPNLLAVFSHAARTLLQVGELANFCCGVSVDGGLAGSDADLVRAERSRRALTSFRFGVAERGLSMSSPPDMDLSCLPMLPPTLPAWASAEDAFANAKCDRPSKAIAIDARSILSPRSSLRVQYLPNRGTGRPHHLVGRVVVQRVRAKRAARWDVTRLLIVRKRRITPSPIRPA